MTTAVADPKLRTAPRAALVWQVLPYALASMRLITGTLAR
jgi:hypothetical protein